jgi:ribosomal protein S18 acetylase RimI-like enzyme
VTVTQTADIVVVPHVVRPVAPLGVLALYRSEGWWPDRTALQVDAVLHGATAVGAWQSDELVGFARAVSDGVLRAYIEDVVVLSRLRRSGIGHALVASLMDQLRPVPVVSLFCTPDLVAFYEASNFRTTKQVVLHRSG